MNRTLRSITLAAATFVLASTLTTAAHAEHAVLGAAIGGGAGALVGQSMGGRDGAMIGGALGAVAGVALTQVHYQPQIYAPQPYYYRQPVVYAPAPVYYPHYERGWERHEHRRYERRWDREREWEHDRYDRRY